MVASLTPLPALVTGASRGLGAALAEALASRGYHIVAVARTTGGLEELDDRIKARGGAATLAPMDVTCADAMAHLCRAIFDRWGGLALWVHTAVHAPPLSPASCIDPDDFNTGLITNVQALCRLIGFVDPLLRAARPSGRAVFFDDPTDGKFTAAYGACKAAQRQIIQSWQAESTPQGAPRVTLLTPPPMGTALRARFFPGEARANLTHPTQAAAQLMNAIVET